MGDPRKDRLIVAVVAIVTRALVVVWGASFGPAADGFYYEKVAQRIAEGHGYTWQWPDGIVTYAAHYPVGYPALIALFYRVFGIAPVVALILNAVLGVLGVGAAYELLRMATRPRLALAGSLVFALHPALLPYTAAIMTEGVTASLLMVALLLVSRARASARPWPWLLGLGFAMGTLTLIRPQSLAFAPFFGWLAGGVRWQRAALTTAFALAVCAPWTIRNCVRMDQCALVSVNGGWNLGIGAQTTNGTWSPIEVPRACREVFQEAAKDRCFGREAEKTIAHAPGAWLARAPQKLRATFDYFGAAPWYLHQSNPEKFPYRAKVILGSIETVASRLLLAAALISVMKLSGARWRARRLVGGAGLLACVLVPGVLGYMALVVAIGLLGTSMLARPVLVPATAIVITLTAVVHAVFFGAGRYGLVVLPFVTLLAFLRESASHGDARNGGLAREAPRDHGDAVDAVQAIAGHAGDGRKVRAPQSTMPGNARSRKREGKCNRERPPALCKDGG